MAAEAGYENALWLLQVLLDDHFYEEGKIKDEDKAGVEKCEFSSRMFRTKKVIKGFGQEADIG